jgi:hypothetical protein
MIVGDHRADGIAPGELWHLEQDTQSGLRRTATLDELDCRMEIDVLAHCEIDRCGGNETGTHERFRPPTHDKGFDRILQGGYGLFEQCLHTKESGSERSLYHPRKAAPPPL